MSQSLSAVLVHLVFGTKHRQTWIRGPIESELHAYATTVLKNQGSTPLALNGMADHVHALFALPRVKTIAGINRFAVAA